MREGNNMNNTSSCENVPSVACYDLKKGYAGHPALDGINLELPRGQVVGLLGPNGSGKTTLLKILAGLLKPSSGTVLVNGKVPGAETKGSVAYLPDRTFFSPSMTVLECFRMFEDMYEDFDSATAMGRISAIEGIPQGAKLKNLSKGILEKVQFSLVMSRNAELYLLDEPLNGVDPVSREYVLGTIGCKKSYSTTIVSTHLVRDVEDILDGFIFLRDGKIIGSGLTSEVHESGRTLDELFREVFR